MKLPHRIAIEVTENGRRVDRIDAVLLGGDDANVKTDGQIKGMLTSMFRGAVFTSNLWTAANVTIVTIIKWDDVEYRDVRRGGFLYEGESGIAEMAATIARHAEQYYGAKHGANTSTDDLPKCHVHAECQDNDTYRRPTWLLTSENR